MREPRNPAPPYMRRKAMHPGAAIPVPEEPKPNLDEITKAATQAAVAGVQQELAKAKAGIAETVSDALQNFVGQQKSVDVVEAIKQAIAAAMLAGITPPPITQTKSHQVDDSTPTFIPDNLVKKGGKKLDMQEGTSVDPSVDEAMQALRASRKTKGHKE
jgi:hypothetical protein